MSVSEKGLINQKNNKRWYGKGVKHPFCQNNNINNNDNYNYKRAYSLFGWIDFKVLIL